MSKTDQEMLTAPDPTAASKVYGGRAQTTEVNRATVAEIVAGMAQQMEQAADETRRFPLSDLETVDRVARRYVIACATAGVLPTVTGAAAAMGRTRTALYKYGNDHPAFSEWLTEFSDLCGEAAAQAAIHGATKEVSTIFTLKSRHGWRDVISIEPIQQNPGITEEDVQAISAKYLELPPE